MCVAASRCRTLVAGFGRPGMRDLDFGRHVTRYLEGRRWPGDVVVEDLSCAAPLVLHRLQELKPAQVVLVGAAARGLEPPGALRRYPVAVAPAPTADAVQRSLEESLQGIVDIDHTLAVARHWGALPADTVVIEVEPADCSFGLGFSEDLAAAFDAVLAMVFEQVGRTEGELDLDELEALTTGEAEEGRAVVACRSGDVAPSDGLAVLAEYRGHHRAMRTIHSRRDAAVLTAPPGLVVAGRSRPWGPNADAGSDWFDVIPLEDGWAGVVLGEAPGRGIAAAPVMADLRMAVRAIAVSDGSSPARVLERLDRLVSVTGTGRGASVVYGAVHPGRGELRLGSAGHRPPLLLTHGRSPEALAMDEGGCVGCDPSSRGEATFRIDRRSALLLFSDGLAVDGRGEEIGACHAGSDSLDELCERVFALGVDDARRDDDVAVLAVRLAPPGAPETVAPE